jgi:hypothetical protein
MKEHFNASGPSGIRTHDLLNAIETRSQLRYGPSLNELRNCTPKRLFRQRVDLIRRDLSPNDPKFVSYNPLLYNMVDEIAIRNLSRQSVPDVQALSTIITR